uniref:Uncharacterized protein n=1 Tax=Rhizophora mucronata TaxID=61149 RepID=A0A2P2N9T0_RHIMU
MSSGCHKISPFDQCIEFEAMYEMGSRDHLLQWWLYLELLNLSEAYPHQTPFPIAHK